MRLYVVRGGISPSRRGSVMVVPRGTRGMRDDNPEVRAETARNMLVHRWSGVPKEVKRCANPACDETVEGYIRVRGKSKERKYCSNACTVADWRRKRREERERNGGAPTRRRRRSTSAVTVT